MRKKLGLSLLVLLFGALLWYLFLKPDDYVVRFKAKALPGTINQAAKLYSNQLKNAQFLDQKKVSDFKYRIQFNDSTYTYHWKIEALNDSISKIKVFVTDDDHSLANRLAIPFSETDLEKRSKKTIQGFVQELEDHLKSFKVNIVGKAVTPSKYCACVSLKGGQSEKASDMMAYYSLLSGIMTENETKLDGRPMVEVEDWNMKKDSITYNFCFPVIKTDSLPQRKGIFYKQIIKRPAIKAVYNGNYISSDRAWYALIDYGEKNNIAIYPNPLEIFYTNPNMGGDALEWEAEVFMPIRN